MKCIKLWINFGSISPLNKLDLSWLTLTTENHQLADTNPRSVSQIEKMDLAHSDLSRVVLAYREISREFGTHRLAFVSLTNKIQIRGVARCIFLA